MELAVDEETKNHKEVDKDIYSPFMTEIKDSKYCPVTSYLTYVMSISKQSDWMWQQAKYRTFPSDPKIRTNYGPGRLGQNPIERFISTIAQKNGLQEEKYTNHCLRVTGINTLTPYFKNKEVRAVRGHESDDSLSLYQKASDEKKLEMGMSIGHALLHVPPVKKPIPAQVKALLPNQSANQNPSFPAIMAPVVVSVPKNVEEN